MDIYIFGNGSMGEAIALGLRDKFNVIVVGRDPKKLKKFDKFNIKSEVYGKSYDIDEKNIILAFKPYALNDVSKILKGKAKICISVLAVTTIQALKCIKADSMVSCIPNIAAKFKASTTPYFTTSNDKLCERIIGEFGDTIKLSDEKDLNVAGVIAGCAPAYLAIVAEALQNGAVKEGLKKELSIKLVNGIFKSTSALLQNLHPVELKENVCSPAGTTIEGIYELEKSAIRSAFINAVSASSKKARS